MPDTHEADEAAQKASAQEEESRKKAVDANEKAAQEHQEAAKEAKGE